MSIRVVSRLVVFGAHFDFDRLQVPARALQAILAAHAGRHLRHDAQPRGGDRAWPPGKVLPRPAPITITYHPALHADPALAARDAALDLAARTHAVIVSVME